jgi:hypothetical protein
VGASAQERPQTLEGESAVATPFPFVYVGQGETYSRKWLQVWISLSDPATEEELHRIARSAPLPFSVLLGFDFGLRTSPDGRLLRVTSDDFLEDYIRVTYNPRFERRLRSRGYWDVHSLIEKLFVDGGDERYPTDDEWASFNRAIDEWLVAIHERHPIALAYKAAAGADEASDWHRWSLSRIVPDVVPTLERSLADREPAASSADDEIRFGSLLGRMTLGLLRLYAHHVATHDVRIAPESATRLRRLVESAVEATAEPGEEPEEEVRSAAAELLKGLGTPD